MDTADLRLYYNVMYYKRAQASKVHRDKGVTKLDGQLTVDSAPATVTLQSVEDDNTSASSEEEEEDVSTKLSWNKRRSMQQKKKKRTSHSNSKVLYSGVQREICKRTLQENDVVVLGGFEVQIIDLRNSQTEEMLSQQQKTSTSLAATKKSLLFGAKKPLIRSTTCYATVPIQPKRAVIPTSVVRSTSEHPQQPPTITRASAKPIYHMKKKAPAQLQPQLPSQKAILTSSVEVKVQLGSILSRKRPLLSSKNTAATKQHRFVAQQPPSSITGTTSTLSADLITTNAILPHIPLPASIRNVLLPHQVVGVDFLWTTLAERKGCILGDEMGLGVCL